MADDLKLKVQLEADVNKDQVTKEVTSVADTAQKTLDKHNLRLKIEDNISDLKRKLEEARIEYQKLLNQPMGWSTDKQLANMEDHMEDLRKQIKEWEKALKDLWETAKDTNEELTKDSGSWWLMWFVNTLKKSAIVWAIATAFWKVSKSILELWSNAQQAEISFTTMLWDANKAKWLLKDLSNFAKKTPFELQWIRESATQLLAMWVSAQDMIPTLKALWDVSAWLNVPLERLALNYGQVLTQWKLTWKELKDFTTAWVPLLDELAKNLWKTKTEIQDMVSAGQIWANDMVEAFRTMTSEWWRFANLMEAQSKTLQGQWSNFKDSLASIWETIWLEVIPAISDFVSKMWSWIEENVNSIKSAWIAVADTIKSVVDWWIQVVSSLWNHINTFSSWVAETSQSIADTVAGTMTESDKVTAEWLTGMAGNWSDFFYYIEQWISGIVWAFKTLFNTADAVFSKVTSKSFWNWLYEAWEVSVNPIDKSWNVFQTIWNWFSEQKRQFSEGYKWMKEYIKWESKDVTKVWNKSLDDMYNNLEDNYVKRVEKLKGGTYSAWNVNGDKKDWWSLWNLLLWWSGSGWWSSSKATDMMKEAKDEMKDLYSEMDTTVSNHQKSYDNLVKSIEKVEKEYWTLQGKADDVWHSLEKSLKSYNEQLEKAQSDAITNLWQRYVELKEKRAETDNDYLKKIVWEISDKEWQLIRDEWWTFKGYDYSELKDVYELYKEMKLIEENTTEEQRKSTEFTEKTSKAQEILNKLKEKEAELEEKKAQALEKQKIAVAVMNQEMWKELVQTVLKKTGEEVTMYYDMETKKWEEIHNVDNIEYAKQLEQQFKELSNQKAQFEQEKNEEVEILVDITARKVQLEEHYNKVFQEAIAKQKRSVEELISYWDRAIARKNEYYSSSSTSAFAYGWDISNAKVALVWENWPEQIIARQASYVQPRNASNSYSTVNSNNTTNSLTINWMSNTYGSIDEMLEDLKWRLTYRD